MCAVQMHKKKKNVFFFLRKGVHYSWFRSKQIDEERPPVIQLGGKKLLKYAPRWGKSPTSFVRTFVFPFGVVREERLTT